MKMGKREEMIKEWEDKGYDVEEFIAIKKFDDFTEVYVRFTRRNGTMHSLNEDWPTIVSLAEMDDLLAIPVSDAENRKIVRLIHIEALAGIRKQFLELDQTLRRSYWAVQQDPEFLSTIIDLDGVMTHSWDVQTEIEFMADSRDYQNLFDTCETDQKWYEYKIDLRALTAKVKQMDPDKLPKGFEEKLKKISEYYEF